MTRIAAILIALAAMTGAAPSRAEAPAFRLSGTSRLRAEAIGGQARAGFGTKDSLLNLRNTLLAQYDDGPLRMAAELWDSRIYGDDARTPVSTGEVNALELVQAYVEVKPHAPFGAGSTLAVQAGRFLLNLGSRRLVAADDYRNTTNGYTGLRGDIGLRGGWKSTLIYVLPQQRRPDDLASLRRNAVAMDREGFDLVLWGGVVSKAKMPGAATVETSFFHLGERDRPARPTRDRSIDTASLRIIRDPSLRQWDGEIEAIAQRGSVSTSLAANAAKQDVRAWFVHADIGYTFAAAWKPRLSIDYDYASGDKPGGTYGRFDTLFGMRRADLAPAGLYNAIARSNIVSPGIRIEAAPGKGSDVMASLRPMWLASRTDSFAATAVRDSGGRSGRFAGTQFDGRIRHKVAPWLQLELDVVVLAKGRFLRDAPNAPPGRWTRYASMNATTSF